MSDELPSTIQFAFRRARADQLTAHVMHALKDVIPDELPDGGAARRGARVHD